MTDLLPHNSLDGERAVACSVARLSAVPLPIRDLWNPDDCPESVLPWLAWALSVDDWDSRWSPDVKRAVIRESLAVHRIKGTPASISRAVSAAGFAGHYIVEWAGSEYLDGPDHWAEYRVYLTRPISTRQARILREMLASIAPVRCRLKELNFSEATHLYNAAITYDGAFNYGVA